MKCGEVTSHNDSQIDPILDNIDPVTVDDWKNEPVHKWCPKQNSCNSTPLCQPCKRRFLIIIATGRSGSTTLTHMLGSLPGVRMAGENDNALRRIFMVSNSRQKTTGFWFKKGAKGSIYSKQNGPWQHNPVPFQGLACAEQHFIEAIIPPALAADGDYRYSQPADGHILGFKTIRFLYELGGPNAIPEEDFNTYLKWFVNAFPCARIVIKLGSLPGVRMAGENDNALRRIFMVSNSRQKTTGFWLKKGSTGGMYRKGNNAWQHNPVPSQGLACAEQHFIEAIIPPVLTEDGDYRYSQPADGYILGFKTIRFVYELDGYNAIPEEDFNTYLKWFVNAFPCARIVINIRSDTKAQAQSQKNTFFRARNKIDVDEIGVDIEDQNQKYVGLAEHLGDRAYFLDSSEWTKNVTKFHGLIDWLGYSEECYFNHLLEYNAHHTYGANKNKAIYKHDKKCNYAGEHKPQ
eukprot:CAMPEP_0183743946 /NCGR_PEP_ID=MMETSP0737-20130205/65479_1 /TAXON_ID=385413 /ORGANISM="Thalassiosira miniscula, Strain CCMP1093" /LENGTH=460 /DNA_ID=CAMNT_0025979579 /DNA_START=186 /DNA_END=1568 /DNA_ORIENTATION=-